ncbi:MAG: FliH/SctL family protein [Gammaproteobacteria bacterium]
MSNQRYTASKISQWQTPQLSSAGASNEPPEKTDEQKIQEAFQKAYEKGYEAGKHQGHQEMLERIAVLEQFINALQRPFDDQNHTLAEQLSQLAGKIAKSLVRRELRTEPEALMALVRDTVAALNSTRHEITVHLNPKTAQVIREIVADNGQEQSWKIIEDPMVSVNDCKVSSMDSVIDADLDTRINLIITQFLGDERNNPRE